MPYLHVKLDVFDAEIGEDTAKHVRELAREFAEYVSDELPNPPDDDPLPIKVWIAET